MTTPPIPPDLARHIWAILVQECGASYHPNCVQSFIWTQEQGDCQEYRFCGALGFGGKFWNYDGRFYVTCYREDKTPARLAMIEQANTRLAALRAEVEREVRASQ